MQRRAYLGALAAGMAGFAGCNGSAGGRSATTGGTEPAAVRFRTETVTMDLEIPWGAAFDPDGVLHLTERPGRVRRVDPDDGSRAEVADFSDAIAHRGEGGLLGLAFHPDDPSLAYTYGTYETDHGLENRVVRHDAGDDFAVETVVLDGIPAGTVHDGGRIAFGPEGALYVATGDAGEGRRAQDPDSLAGKVLRVTPDGDPHPDNPEGGDPRVFTTGHRNPQGLAWRDGTLFSTEHGPDTDDEVNVLRAGNDYGWPEVTGPSDREAFTDPVASYTPTVAPASAAFYDGPIDEWRGDLFFGTLAGRHLHRARIDGESVVEDQRLLDDEYGRLRTALVGPDDHLYVTTSNRDGRGMPAPQDDRVLRVLPA
ncbi:PQQ-dependent sugar dehydrogenase [Halorussus salilacus]|uniref:PQQ-dependent sugar dehydrogenase n=1 Tax=Halorussus salilacus TaxID=2953750 RepID=UPI0020A20470|nr:PQQ-dependent sugar dehydrogenase [Halorussus salilacus]USZ67200.1 PQQ-dependent sugar dehydrogenase [Halorussus salilacus]